MFQYRPSCFAKINYVNSNHDHRAEQMAQSEKCLKRMREVLSSNSLRPTHMKPDAVSLSSECFYRNWLWETGGRDRSIPGSFLDSYSGA